MSIEIRDQRSELENLFRKRAADSLREFRSLDRKCESLRFKSGITYGIYLGYKTAANDVGYDVYDAKPRKARSIINPNGAPVHLKQPVDTTSLEIEAGNHQKLSPSRANPHD